MNKQKLKRLTAQWYKKLADSGFVEIEDVNSPNEMLKRWTSEISTRHTAQTLQDRQDYYLRASHLLESEHWPNPVDKQIWALFCEGHSTRTIYEMINVRRKKRSTRIGSVYINKLIRAIKARYL